MFDPFHSERYELRLPRDRFAGARRGLLHALGAWLLLLLLLDGRGDGFAAPSAETLLYSLGAALAWGLVVFLSHKSRGRVPPIELRDEGLRGPLWGGEEERTVPYRQLRIAHAWRLAGDSRLVLGVEGAPALAFPGGYFEDSAAPGRIAESIRRRIAELPGGDEQLRAMDRRAALAERIQTSRIPATRLIALVLAALFALQLAAGGPLDPVATLALGANSTALVAAGEWHRLITANLLHGGLLHLALNVWGLLLLGRLLEPLLGAWRFVTYFGLCCLAGAAASAAITRPWLSLGASTGVAGLLGVYCLFAWRRHEDFPTAPSRLFWLLLPLAFLLPALFFNVDHAAHAGGFLVGAALAAAELGAGDLLALARRRRGVFVALGAALATLFLGTQAWAIERTFGAGGVDRAALERVLLADPGTPPQIVNYAAWMRAVDPRARPDELAAARRAMQRAIEAEDSSELRDTLATLHYRLGELERAIELEAPLAAARGPRREFYRSQLARFELARARRDGPRLELPPGTGPPRLGLLDGVTAEAPLRPRIELVVPPELAGNALVVRGAVVAGERLLGTFDARSGRWPEGASLGELPVPLAEATAVELLAVERPRATPEPSAAWSFDPIDPEVSPLP